MHSCSRKLLVAALPLLLSAALRCSGELEPAQVYQDGGAMLAPDTAVGGASLGPPTLAVTAADCSVACRSTAGCALFQWCSIPGGCSAAPGETLGFHMCQLLASNCTLLPEVLARGGGQVQVTSGFPVREAPQSVLGFTEVPGQGIAGGDFPCPLSVIPDKCAYSKLLDAASMCVGSLNCHAVVWYHNGTDGCSDPVGVLKQEGLSPDNSFVAPGVTTLQQQDELAAVSSRLYLGDGEMILPSDAELEAATAAAAAAGRDLGSDTTWKGCFVGRNAILDGKVVGLVDGVPTAEACCRRCRQLEVNGSGGVCNAWNWCSRSEGCRFTDSRDQTYSLEYRQCEQRFQPLSVPAMGWPPNLLAKGPAVSFQGGAPIAVWGPPQPGYERYLGFGLFSFGRFNCTDSLAPQLQECVHSGTMEWLQDFCKADSECVGFVLKPGGLYLSGPGVGIFKHDTDPSKILFNPTGVLYLQEGTGSSGLSTGAIVGIAVAATVGGAALAGAAWLLLRRRRQRRQRLASAHSAGEDKAAAEGSSCSERGDCESPTAPPSELQPAPQRVVMQLSRRPSDSLVSPFTASAAAAAIFGSTYSESGRMPSGTAAAAGSRATAAAAAAAAVSSLPGTPSSGESVPPLHPALSRKVPHAASRPSRLQGSQRVSFNEDAALAAAPPASAATGSAIRVPSVQPPPTPSELIQRSGGAGSTSGAASLAIQPAAFFGIGALDRDPSAFLTASGTFQSAAPLPELVQHVAAQDVLAVGSGGGTSRASSDSHVPVSAESLPPRLREWLVHPELVEYQRWPNGKLQELGAGASARVYRALYNGEVIAAKEIEIERSPAMQEAFLTEALRLQALRHPHIVSFYGVMLKEAKGVVLMEFCEGRDLHSALELMAAGTEQRLFGWHRRGRRVAYDVAKALNYLHSKGVVHMDVKSSNVLLTASGTAKLADVAFSRLQTGTFLSDLPLIGTFAWVAPEVLLGGRQCTAAVDIYSLGVCLWEIITGERPQRGCMRSPHVPEECPQDAADLLDRMLSQDPSDRPTAQEVLQQLGRMLGTHRAPPSSAYLRGGADSSGSPAPGSPPKDLGGAAVEEGSPGGAGSRSSADRDRPAP